MRNPTDPEFLAIARSPSSPIKLTKESVPRVGYDSRFKRQPPHPVRVSVAKKNTGNKQGKIIKIATARIPRLTSVGEHF
ncbi:hypothetical protein QR685DRAFT_575417 [Neurospora intermedia]|uniref:Uncharacterized protein n=1 Tax=Neurospora intermedia TaxID=5142 RepID=A0ABR3D0M8_NEUIN